MDAGLRSAGQVLADPLDGVALGCVHSEEFEPVAQSLGVAHDRPQFDGIRRQRQGNLKGHDLAGFQVAGESRAYAVLAYCLWINGREGLSKRLPGRLDWADFVRFKQTVDWRQYGVFTEVVRERSAEYGPLAAASTAGTERGPLEIQLGNAIARHVLGHSTKVGPMESLWCAGLFREIGATVPAALNNCRYRPDPEAEAQAAAAPDEPEGDLILTCGACGQKNRVRAGRRRQDAVCGRCGSPL